MSDQSLLRTTLQVAVPLWVMQLRERPFSELAARAPELGHIVAEKGDIIQFKSKNKGETAAAFNALAEGIAILSFLPGGITFMEDHYENTHPEAKNDG